MSERLEDRTNQTEIARGHLPVFVPRMMNVRRATQPECTYELFNIVKNLQPKNMLTTNIWAQFANNRARVAA
jgi:hypothetical protein